VEAQQELLKNLRAKIDLLDFYLEKTKGEMQSAISNLEGSLIAHVN